MVRVKLFGSPRLDSGVRELTAEADSVKALYPQVLEELRRRNPESAVTEKDLLACLVAVNGKQSTPRAKLRDGDEVWFLPAVAGG